MCSSRRKTPAALRLGVTAQAFEDGRAVVDDVGHDVDLRLLPGNHGPLCQMFFVVSKGIPFPQSRTPRPAEAPIIPGWHGGWIGKTPHAPVRRSRE